ncbi:MAG: Na+/H+ antiporter subunit E [Lachnospiraceae bacterium]|nr:Na+/H+ antiporter subunit E [Candidatus Colinaster scatohippi]
MFVLFFIIWLIFNGQVTLEIAIFGLIISAGMYWFICKFCGYSPKREKINIMLALMVLKYICILIWEIIKANMSVIGLIMNSRNDIEPAVVRFSTDLRTESARVLLANSITMTPGTITVSLENNEYVVHCLDKSLADGINESVFVNELRKMEKVGEGYKC